MDDAPNPFLQFRQGYYDECAVLLSTLHEDLTAPQTAAAVLDCAHRAVHSIRGGAAAFGLRELDTFTTVFEHAVDKLLDSKPDTLDEPRLDLLRRCAARLEEHLEASRGSTPWPPERDEELTAELRRIAGLPEPEKAPGIPARPARKPRAKPKARSEKTKTAVPLDIQVEVAPDPAPEEPVEAAPAARAKVKAAAAAPHQGVAVAELRWQDDSRRPSLLDGRTSLFEGLWNLPYWVGLLMTGLRRGLPTPPKRPATRRPMPDEDDLLSEL